MEPGTVVKLQNSDVTILHVHAGDPLLGDAAFAEVLGAVLPHAFVPLISQIEALHGLVVDHTTYRGAQPLPKELVHDIARNIALKPAPQNK